MFVTLFLFVPRGSSLDIASHAFGLSEMYVLFGHISSSERRTIMQGAFKFLSSQDKAIVQLCTNHLTFDEVWIIFAKTVQYYEYFID